MDPISQYIFSDDTRGLRILLKDPEYEHMLQKPNSPYLLQVFNSYPPSMKMFKCLLENGARIRTDNYEVLRIAAENHRVDFLKILIILGANVNAKDENGKTAINRIYDQDLNIPDVANTRIKIIKELVKAGANINHVDGHGNTLLYDACSNEDNVDVVRTILKLGAKRERDMDDMIEYEEIRQAFDEYDDGQLMLASSCVKRLGRRSNFKKINPMLLRI